MDKKGQKPQTKRFVEVFNLLIKNGTVNSAAEFCTTIDYLTSSFSSVIKGRRDIPLSAINAACSRYNINRNYILDGTGPAINDPNIVAEPKSQYGSDVIKDLKIKHLEEKCALYEQEIEWLKSIVNPQISTKHPQGKKEKH